MFRRFGRRCRRRGGYGLGYGAWNYNIPPESRRGFGMFGQGWGWRNKPWKPGLGFRRGFFGIGMGREGWGRGWGFAVFPISPVQPIETQTIEVSKKEERSVDPIEKAKAILKEAYVGTPTPGDFLIPIYHKGEIVGYLWSNVPLSKVKPGNVHEVNGEKRVALIYEDKIVGYIRV